MRFGGLTLLFLFLSALPSLAADVRRAKVIHAPEGVRVDGVLNDEVWEKSPSIDPFVQADPYPGQPPAEPTEVRIAYGKDALYIAVRCFDSKPETILSTTMARDGRPFDDDSLEIVLDTFLDRRSGYYFQLNAAGSMSDGRIVENRLTDVSWDGIWNAVTRIDNQGWTAEIEIPFKTLSFDPASTSWGFNIERTIARVNEESRWESHTRDATIHAVSRAGVIDGLEGLSQGIGLDVKPYGLLGVNRDANRADTVEGVRDAGMDIFYRVTSNLLSSTTINTDFAETEVDTRQVNLTRFPLFFHEKRAFFLEEAGVFSFGLPGGGNTIIPFFSRRIGLVGGETAPISIGEKLTGKVGRLEMGLLDVMTRDSDAAPGENLFTGRAKLGFWKQSYAGAIFTSGEPSGRTSNSLAGADVVLATSNFLGRQTNFDFGVYGLKTNTPGIRSKDFAYGAQARYPNDRLSLSYSWQDIGANFNPELGYVQRRDVRINNFSSRLGTRPKIRNIRQVSFGFGFTQYDRRSLRAVETREYRLTPVSFLFHGGQILSYEVSHEFERLFEPFDIHEGISIPAGDYSVVRHEMAYSGPTNKPVKYSVEYERGSFYTGNSDEVVTTFSWKKSAHITAGVELHHYRVSLKEGKFNTSLALFRYNHFFSPRLALTNFIQYDTDSQNIGLQSRLRWIVRPGNEIHMVFNHEWQEDPLDRFVSRRTDLRAKLNYTVRF